MRKHYEAPYIVDRTNDFRVYTLERVPELSGNGRIAWYVESNGITVEQIIAPSDLKRRDLETGHTISIDVPGFKDPAMISGDGNTTLIRTIPERNGVDTPQNVMELMLVDVNSGTVQRVAPGRDILWVVMTPSANHIAYLDERADDGTYLGVPRLLTVNRQ